MPALSEEQSSEATVSASRRLDDIEDAALRLAPFLAAEAETLGELNSSARLLASFAFAANGELIARHYRRFKQIVKKSRSESDVPVQPVTDYASALALASEAVENAIAISDALEPLYEDTVDTPGGEAYSQVSGLYRDSINLQIKSTIQVAMAIEHGLLLVNAGFDFDGISAAVKSPEDPSDDRRTYL